MTDLAISSECPIAERLYEIELTLARDIASVSFVNENVHRLYNPVSYAKIPKKNFLNKYMDAKKRVLFLGMFPNMAGMAQTGIPFGEPNIVRDWMNVSGYVKQPYCVHPKQPVFGFAPPQDYPVDNERNNRIWNMIKELSKTPENFFKHCGIYNYCPTIFMSDEGEVIDPNKMQDSDQNVLHQLCDEALYEVMDHLEVKIVVALGRLAEKRANYVVSKYGLHTKVVFLYDPSSELGWSNDKWIGVVQSQLVDLDLLGLLKAEEI